MQGVLAARLTRWLVAVHIAALAAQLAAAIALASGIGQALAAHALIAKAVLALGAAQLLALLNPGLPKLGRIYLAFAALVALGEAALLFLVPRGQWPAHVTIAMIVWGCALALYVRLLDPQWLPKACSQ